MFVFSSATEDIGISINERNNVIKLSNFALLDIPEIGIPNNINKNTFNVFGIDGAFKNFVSGSIKDGRVIVAESFQNYALNLETNLLNQATYNPALTATVSERVFWKWLKETGAVRWEKDASNAGYFVEELDTDVSVGYNSVVKYIGEISAGSIRSDTFGTYNETYILIPTSHGQTQVFFKQEYDDNFSPNISIGPGQDNILGRETYTKPHPDGLSLQAYYDVIDSSTVVNPSYIMSYFDKDGIEHPGWWYTAQGKSVASSSQNYYLTDSSSFIQDPSYYNTTLKYGGSPNIIFKRSNVDGLTLEYDIDNLKTIYGDPTLTYDKIAIDYSTDVKFNFNAVLIYYSVYNQSLDKVLATNLLGVLFLDTAYGNTSNFPSIEGQIVIPGLTKLQSNISGFGNSYSFRVNIKSDNMMDDTQATIVDESTSSQADLENWTDVFSDLEKSISILNSHTSTINYITSQYNNISDAQINILNKVIDIQNSVQEGGNNISGTPGVIPMFDSGTNPLIDSSIYMLGGFVGVKTNNPKYPLDVDGSTKVKTLYIENSIRDTSNNILIGYGSPLQLGSDTVFREMEMYTGNVNPAISIDTSNYVTFDKKLTQYLIESSLGNSFYWNVGHLDVSAGSGFYTLPIATGVTLGGIKVGSGLTIDNSSGVLSVTTGTYVTKTYVDASLNSRDVSIASKADKVYVDSSLNLKANKTYVDASLNVKTSFTYVDSSLLARDASITFLFNNIGTGFATINYVDGSLSKRDVSIAWLNANRPSFTYVDGSLARRDACINFLYQNVGTGYATYAYVDGSLNLKTNKTYVDASLNVKTNKTYVDSSLAARDVSIDWLNINKADYAYVNGKADTTYVDASLLKRDACIDFLYLNVGSGFTTFAYVDGSLNVKANTTYVDASLNVKTNKTYVDSSLATRDTSIAWLNSNKANITYVNSYATTKSYVDASLLLRDNSIAYLNTYKADASSLKLYLKEASIGSGLAFHAGLLDVSISGITETLMSDPHYYRQTLGVDTSGDIKTYINLTGRYTQQYDGSGWINKETIIW